MSMAFAMPASYGEQTPKDKVRLVGAYNPFSLAGPGVQEKNRQHEALLLAPDHDSISRGNRVAPLTEADFLVGAASVAMFRLDLTCSS